MFMFKINLAMKSLDKKTNSHPHYKAAPGRLSYEKRFLKHNGPSTDDECSLQNKNNCKK